MPVENTNLRACATDNGVTHAEAFRTSQTASFFGREYLSLVELLNDKRPQVCKTTFGEIDARNPRKRKVTIRDVATLYGQRPRHPDLWYLSPYEFVMKWEPKLLSYPTSLTELTQQDHHVKMTSSGLAKLEEQCQTTRTGKRVDREAWDRLRCRRRRRVLATFPRHTVHRELPPHVDPCAPET